MKIRFLLIFLILMQFSVAQSKFNLAATQKFQTKLNAEFANAKTSPLLPEDLKNFKTLDFFPIQAAYFVTAKLVKSTGEKPFEMKTSTARKPKYVKYGTVYFSIKGKKMQLNVYRNLELVQKKEYKNHLFLPFSDLTSGKESYIGGRYIDLEIPKNNQITIDFNQAYNPYCAYNPNFSCPIVPLENDLNIAIEAGVKKFHD
ncbi:DUF1684 domain-containing protein [Flavobacterium agrisoli]|uniref:DUF1684 domain-containing protein n=1 Tax=Flavobacterium agrisoli TaxID=2793066 RepID=A0A934PKJ8_9FLAO|nr:DUF1684 domain-containing protein [Flavobacterium agrisoli]MBK0368995.1 DUF1684 domain-containing protein [Flavobacterium agrisoli]